MGISAVVLLNLIPPMVSIQLAALGKSTLLKRNFVV